MEGTAEEAEGNGGRLVSGEPPSVLGDASTAEATARFPPAPRLRITSWFSAGSIQWAARFANSWTQP